MAQKSIQDYVDKYDRAKLKKQILIDQSCKPITHKSYVDGHGKTPYLSSTDQLPKTIAIITFNISDLGFSTSWQNDWYRYTKYFSVTEAGGNQIANAILDQTYDTLKAEFAKRGATLLTIDEVLDTQEKKDYYYETFAPELSKLGKFLSNIENRGVDKAVCADYYRYFDLGAAWDFRRANSIGSELANALGVDAVLSVGNVVQTRERDGNFRTVKMAIHGPNPNPKMDKKYIGQKNGVGYYDGHIYIGGTLTFKKAIPCMALGDEQITSIELDGLETVYELFIERFYEEMNAAITKVSSR